MMYDVAVLGGGPAGMAAATEAARAGARTVLLEESLAPGGQVYRKPAFDGPRDADQRHGDALRASLAASGAEVLTGVRVWGLGGGPLVTEGHAPFVLNGLGAEVSARALILATGTHERIIPFPGWTLPGVLGLAAATILLKAQGVLPGRRVVVAGQGPLLYAVAAKIIAGGGQVVAIADAAMMGEWARALPRLAARPDVLAHGACASLLRACRCSLAHTWQRRWVRAALRRCGSAARSSRPTRFASVMAWCPPLRRAAPIALPIAMILRSAAGCRWSMPGSAPPCQGSTPLATVRGCAERRRPLHPAASRRARRCATWG